MIPVLYVANETNFNHNGVGVLSDCVSCVVTEERNGIYECEFSYPITGAFYGEISPDRIVKVKASEYADGQLFRIYRSSKPINGIVKFYCQHISYDLNTNIVNPFKAESVNAVTALTRVLENCYYQHSFTATSTNGTTSTIDIKVPTPARSCLGGMKGSILDNFGGEYEFDNFTIKLHGSRGQDNGVTILYGKNLTAIKADTNLQNTYTAVYPYATDTDGNTTVLTEKVIETDAFNSFGEPKVLALDLSDKFTEQEITEEKIRQYANSYITQNKIQDIYQNIEISFVQLWQTEEYKNISLLERVGLCDIVTVKYPALGVSVKAKVVKTVYDALKEKYQKIELGKVRSDFGESLKKLGEQVKEASELNKSAMQRAIENATKLITGQDGGYVVMNATADGHPYEILIMNTDNIQTATKLWRWNLGGLGYSSTGYNGQYGTAITMDGAIVADYITTGTLNAGLIKAGIIEDEAHKNYWNMISGEFKLSNGTSDAIKYESGVLSINADFVTGGVLQDTNGVNYWNMTSGEFKLSDGTTTAISYENNSLSINASCITTGNLNAGRITAGILQDANSTNYWNLDTGEFRLSASTKVGTASSNQALSSYVSNAASGALTQTAVFNALTNNGALQGIYMYNGDLYINGSYIQTGTLNADLIKSGSITSTNGRTSISMSTGNLTINQALSGQQLILDDNGMRIKYNNQSVMYCNSNTLHFDNLSGKKMSLNSSYLSFSNGSSSLYLEPNSVYSALKTSNLELSGNLNVAKSINAKSVYVPYSAGNSTYIDATGLSYKGNTLLPVQISVNGSNYYVLAYPVPTTPVTINSLNLSTTSILSSPFVALTVNTGGDIYVVAAYNTTQTGSGTDITTADVSYLNRGFDYELHTIDNVSYAFLTAGAEKSNAATVYDALTDSSGHRYMPMFIYFNDAWQQVFGFRP